jgi:hypothetical protein
MEYELKTDVSANGIITQRLICDQVQELSRWVCDTREDAIKQALISLGWTPPNNRIHSDRQQKAAGVR